jgi:hypothetical protein
MTLEELLTALERLGDGDWQILDVRSAEEAEGSGHPEVGSAPPEGHQGPTTTPPRRRRRLRKTADTLVVKIWLRIN